MSGAEFDRQELQSLRDRITELEARLPPPAAPRSRAKRGLLIIAVVMAGAMGTAFASAPCANGLPFCFVSDTPAQANEVNADFAQLVTWIQTKVGPVSSGTISATGLSVVGPLSQGDTNTGGIEFKHTNLSQGIGFGFNTIYATGNAADQSLNLKAKGSLPVTVMSALNVSGATTFNGPINGLETRLGQASGVGNVSVSCSGNKRILWAEAYTNDSNSPCNSTDRQVRCSPPVFKDACVGQTSCSYSGSSGGCGNAGNTCLYAVCL